MSELSAFQEASPVPLSFLIPTWQILILGWVAGCPDRCLCGGRNPNPWPSTLLGTQPAHTPPASSDHRLLLWGIAGGGGIRIFHFQHRRLTLSISHHRKTGEFCTHVVRLESSSVSPELCWWQQGEPQHPPNLHRRWRDKMRQEERGAFIWGWRDTLQFFFFLR